MKLKSKTQPTICSNCGHPIGKMGACMPSGDPKRRTMCVGCAKKVLKEVEHICCGYVETANATHFNCQICGKKISRKILS